MRRGLAVIIASSLSIVVSHAQQPGTQGLPPYRQLPPHGAPTVPQGSAAITPHLAAVPAFTLDDARLYVATHPLLGAGRDYKPNVTRTEFLTNQQVRERLHGVVTGLPADHVLCYVELQGPFSFPGPQGAVATYNRGVLIFDAQTGNLIISGGMP